MHRHSMGPAFLRRQAAGRLAVNVRDTALVVCAVGLVTLVFQLHSRGGGSGMHDTSILARMGGGSAASAAPSCCRYVKPIPYLEDRDAIGRLLEEEEGMTRGIELGVQRGAYAETILGQWTKCKQYTLVDVWGQQENYDDIANVSNDEQEAILREAHSRLDKFGKRGTKVEFLRMLTSEAAPHIPDGSLDFVYVDARHDYCGVKEDMELYWPKLREGGIMAGHDFVQPVSWEKVRNPTCEMLPGRDSFIDYCSMSHQPESINTHTDGPGLDALRGREPQAAGGAGRRQRLCRRARPPGDRPAF